MKTESPDNDREVLDLKKQSFFRSAAAAFGQVLLWVLLAVVLVILWLAEKEYSWERFKEFACLFILVESFVSLPVPLTFLRVTLCEKNVEVKFLFFTFRRLAAEDIRQVGIFEKMSGSSPVCYVFFSKRQRDVNEINKAFERNTDKDIIFLSYPQKNLKNTIDRYFPNKFDESKTFVFAAE